MSLLKVLKIASVLGAALVLSGCVTVGSGFSNFGRGSSPEMVQGIGHGSSYESYITGRDAANMSAAFNRAMGGPVGDGRHWRNNRSGADGEIVAGGVFLRNVDYSRGRQLIAPLDLETDYPLEPAQGDYSLISNTNVRLGPTTTSTIVDTLETGTVLEAVGHVRGQDWMLMARDGQVIGYMFAALLQQRDGGDLLLAGGAARTPTYCRRFIQNMRMRDGISDQWRGTACRNARNEWYIEGAQTGVGS